MQTSKIEQNKFKQGKRLKVIVFEIQKKGNIKMSIREKIYELKNLNKILHTTFNPYEPGAARIYLIPPKFSWLKSVSSVVIVNGHDIIPLRESWSILLSIFIEEVNKYSGKEISKEELDKIVDITVKRTKKVYGRFIKDDDIKRDLWDMVNTFKSIAIGEKVENKIPRVSIGEYAKHMKAPHRMDLMISSLEKDEKWNCNQKCVHCYAAGQSQANVKELTTSEWKKIIDKCRKAGISQLTFTGGEPTIRGDLVELVEYSKWFVTRLNTNGVLLTKELCKKLYQASLDSVQITLYSSNREIHNELVGANNYDKTVEGIKNALEAGLNVSINTPLCTKNKDYVETLKFLSGLGIKYISCSGLIVTGNAKKDESKQLQLSSEELYEILKQSVQYCNDNLIEISFTSPGWIENKKVEELGLDIPSCGACLSNMAIAPNGDVMPCQSWLSESGKLGNILKDKWKDIWQSKKCKDIRNKSSKTIGKCLLKG